MNSQETFSPIGSGEPEIYRVLKLGSFAVSPTETPADNVLDTHGQTQNLTQKEKKVRFELPPRVKDFIKSTRGFLIYPIIFGVSFLVFYTGINFPSLAAQAQGLFATGKQDQEVLGEDLTAYNSWISGYFYAVSNRDLLTTTNDYDHDGLTNYDEYVMRTNPTVSDSDNDGTTDGVELLNGTNPWGAGGLTKPQLKLRDQVNLNMVSERITYNVSANQGKVTSTNAENFDLTRPGTLSIPKLKISAPLIFSPDPSTFDEDLEHGVIHYPGTAMPGEIGAMYVSGHSSDYFWKHDKFATIFTKINYLEAGDDIFVTVYGKDGKVYNFRYRVTGQKIYSPDDQTQFIDNSEAKLNLSTCWPIGTSKDRMVVSAVLSPL